MIEVAYNLPNDEYRARLDFISVSELNVFSRAPLLYKKQILERKRKGPTKAQNDGTMFHELFLEPDVFKNKYQNLLEEKPDARTKVGKEKLKEIDALAAAGVHTIDLGTKARLEAARDALLSHPRVREKYDGIITEASYFGTDFDTGAQIKARIDAEHHGSSTLIDLKTTDDAAGFYDSVRKYKYYRQAAFYLSVIEEFTGRPWRWEWWTVELQEPHLYKVYTADKDMILQGRAENQFYLRKFLDCKSSGHFPGLSHDVEELSLKRKEKETIETEGVL